MSIARWWRTSTEEARSMTKVSVAINGRTWFTYVPRRAALDLSTVVHEGEAESRGPCVVNSDTKAIGGLADRLFEGRRWSCT
jgi:hypothetical protein